jgi:hypothetical protein
MKYIRWTLIIIIGSILLSSCARQTSPTGGPKDSIPPTKQYSIPPNGTTNFHGKEVEIEFDETIALNNPKEQIIITPDVQKKYNIIARKRKVVLTFDATLSDSTTYTINFRNSVQDITEKNNARNLKIAFSTGSYIDSISIAGTVTDPATYKDVKQATVALYSNDTFSIFKHKPTILTETDDKGNFIIENLKPGKYFVYTILDKNRNLIADSKTETYGFLSDSIILKSNIKSVELPLQKLDMRSLKLISARPYNTYYNIKTSKNLHKYNITSERSKIFSTFGETTDNVKVYNAGLAEGDSIKITFTAIDSIDNKLDTVLYAKFTPKKPKPETFTVKSEGFKVFHTKGLLIGTIKYSKPVAAINTDSMSYKIDSLHTINIALENLTMDTLRNTIHIEQPIDKTLIAKPLEAKTPQSAPGRPRPPSTVAKQNHTLTIGKGALISVEQDSSAAISESLKPIYFDETGIIFVTVDTKAPTFVVELLDNSFKLVKSVSSKHKVTFDDLPPADYQIRLIIDTDNNGKWTPGNFQKRQDAEKTILYKNEKGISTIKLKANFELGPLLIKY